MNIQELISKAVSAFTKDNNLKDQFLSNPVQALEKVLGVDLPDDIVNQVVDGVKKALSGQEAAGGILDKIKGLFGGDK